MLELYHNDMSTCAQKVRSQLAEKGLEWSGPNLNLRAGEQHTPEFLKLNPKGVVPVLVHDGFVVTESNIILEYVEDAFPDRKRLLAATAQERARTRYWLQKLDSGLHLAIAVISIGVAFRDQLLAVHTTPEALEKFYLATPDPALRNIYRSLVPAGVDSPQFAAALEAWLKCFTEMEDRLASQPFLVGELSLADFGIVPYAVRFEHLRLEHAWAGLPNVAAWFGRMKQTAGYRGGIETWLNPKYLSLMGEKGAALLPRTTPLIDEMLAPKAMAA